MDYFLSQTYLRRWGRRLWLRFVPRLTLQSLSPCIIPAPADFGGNYRRSYTHRRE